MYVNRLEMGMWSKNVGRNGGGEFQLGVLGLPAVFFTLLVVCVATNRVC